MAKYIKYTKMWKSSSAHLVLHLPHDVQVRQARFHHQHVGSFPHISLLLSTKPEVNQRSASPAVFKQNQTGKPTTARSARPLAPAGSWQQRRSPNAGFDWAASLQNAKQQAELGTPEKDEQLDKQIQGKERQKKNVEGKEKKKKKKNIKELHVFIFFPSKRKKEKTNREEKANRRKKKEKEVKRKKEIIKE